MENDRVNGMREYFLKRKAENEKALADMLALGYRLKQVAQNGQDIDVTDQHLDGLRRAIKEYQEAADMLDSP